jgi:fructokinase
MLPGTRKKNNLEEETLNYIISLGEILIDIIPATQIRLGEACYTPHPGGALANVAVAAARLGGSSRFIGALSEDEFGRLLEQVLSANSVDTRYIRVVKDAPTAIALVTLAADGQRNFTFFREGSADSRLQVEDLDWGAWRDAAICHVGGVLLSCDPARSATFAAMDYSRSHGCIVSFDVNVRPSLWSSPAAIPAMLARGLARSDILKLSAEEAEFVIPGHSASLDQLGEALLERGPRLVVITSGARGALLMTGKRRIEVPALPVRALDTTGAGDAFMGALLCKLLQQGQSAPADLLTLTERDLLELGTFANQVAGLSVTRYGGISSFPYAHELDGLPHSQEPPGQ